MIFRRFDPFAYAFDFFCITAFQGFLSTNGGEIRVQGDHTYRVVIHPGGIRKADKTNTLLSKQLKKMIALFLKGPDSSDIRDKPEFQAPLEAGKISFRLLNNFTQRRKLS